MANKLTPQEQARLNELQKKGMDIADAINKILDERNTSMQSLAESHAAAIRDLEAQKKALQDILDLSKSLETEEISRYAEQERRNQLTEVENQLKLKQLDLLRAEVKLGDVLTEEQGARLKELENEEKQLKRNEQSFKNIEKTVSKTGLSIHNNLVQGMNDFAVAANQGKLGAFALGKIIPVIDKAISSTISTTKNLVHEMDKLTKEFEKQFQLGQQYTKMLQGVYVANNQYGVSVSEVQSSLSSLVTITTDYTMMSKAQKGILLETGAVLQQWGVSAQDYAQGLQNSMKLYGQTRLEAENTSRELLQTARALGVAPAQLSAQYAQMGPSLAKFGAQGEKTFKELARVQKLTGMEMEKVLALTNKFDTFEGAAQQAGQLNAALGGNFVNAMDLMMETDPVARFEMMRDSLTQAGLSFDEMSYYQKQFFAESMGLSDVADLALLMSGNTDLMTSATNKSAKQIEEEKRAAQEQLTIKEKLAAAQLQIAEAFLPLIPIFDALASGLLKIAPILKYMSFALGAIGLKMGVVAAAGWIKKLDLLKDGFKGLAAAVRSTGSAMNVVYGVVGMLAYYLFEKVFASNFLQGIGKLAVAFTGLSVAIIAVRTAMRGGLLSSLGSVGGMLGGLIGKVGTLTRGMGRLAMSAGRGLLGAARGVGGVAARMGDGMMGGAGRMLGGLGRFALGRGALGMLGPAGLAVGAGMMAYKYRGKIAGGAKKAWKGAKGLLGFDAGGYTGPGASDMPAGMVHGNEVVVPGVRGKQGADFLVPALVQAFQQMGASAGGKQEVTVKIDASDKFLTQVNGATNQAVSNVAKDIALGTGGAPLPGGTLT